jgi:parallel beta-helix repeat protein
VNRVIPARLTAARTLLTFTLAIGLLLGLPSTQAQANAEVLASATSPRQSEGPVGCSIWVTPGENTALVVAGAPEGAVVCFQAGLHRLTEPLRPRAGQHLVGEPGAILRGSKVLDDWRQQDGHWFVAGQTQRLYSHGEGRCRAGFELCHRAENVFVDGEWLRQVQSLDQLRQGTFFFDYARDRIWLATDPRGRLVEATITGSGIRSSADRVTVRGLRVEQFGNYAQNGAIHIEGHDWVVADNVVRLNHGVGIRTMRVKRATIRSNRITHQGQLGIGGHGTDLLVEGNEIAYNNQAGFNPGWEAGGSKWVTTSRLVVRGNHVHHNHGPGLWTDGSNIHSLYEDNLVENNDREGIFHEISYDAVVRRNTVRGNGFVDARWAYGAGILIAGSPNVTVHHNTVAGNARGIVGIQQDRGAGDHGPYELTNLHVHDNTVTMTTGWSGVMQDVGDSSYFTRRNNRFQGNRYALPDLDARLFAWDNRSLTSHEWTQTGNDATGAFMTGDHPDVESAPDSAAGHDSGVEGESSRRFLDVPANHPHAEGIYRIAERGIARGCHADRYCPADPVTRAQMATLLAQVRGLDVSDTSPLHFTDVPPTLVHRPSILAVARAQITRGCDATRYCPSPPITRGQMATFLANALALEAEQGPGFADVPPTHTHAAAIAAVSAAGITLGCDENRFCAAASVTRGQMATFLARALDAELVPENS